MKIAGRLIDYQNNCWLQPSLRETHPHYTLAPPQPHTHTFSKKRPHSQQSLALEAAVCNSHYATLKMLKVKKNITLLRLENTSAQVGLTAAVSQIMARVAFLRHLQICNLKPTVRPQ